MADDGSIRLLRWIEKYHPRNANLIREAINELMCHLSKFEFILKDDTFEGVKTQINSVNFERTCPDVIDYILVIFDKNDPLKFQVSFGSKEKSEPFEWIRAGSFVKRKSDSVSAKWWGAGWISFSSEQDFKRDWKKFLTNTGDIQDFLAGKGERGFVRARTIGG